MKKYLGIACPLLAAVSTSALAAPHIPANALVAKTDAKAPVNFEMYLPLRNKAGLEALLAAQQTAGSASYHKWLTPTEFAAQFGPTAASLSRVKAAAAAAGLSVTSTKARSIHVAGTAAQVEGLFHTSLRTVTVNGASTLMANKLVLPAALKAEGVRVISFTGLPPKRPFSTFADAKPVAGKGRLNPDNRSSTHGPYRYNDLKQAYDYPSYNSFLPNGNRLDGTGVKVAVLMSDLLYPNDVAKFFNNENFTATTGKPVPTVATIKIDGGGRIGGPGSTEASLDVQQVLGGAPGSSVTLISIPDLYDERVMDGYNYIVNQNQWDVVNSSFGGCELYYKPEYNDGVDYTDVLQTYEEIFAQGNAQGITFVASSGDRGGLECTNVDYFNNGPNPAFIPGVSTPAASPHVTAVGGTNLVTVHTVGSLDSAYFGENGYGDPEKPQDPYNQGKQLTNGYWGAGGGVSTIFARPSYQVPVNTGSSYRTLPDVGMEVGGCPSSAVTPCGPDRSSAVTVYNNSNISLIGTSVSSPEFVGALALYIQKAGKRVGNFNSYLYQFGKAQTVSGGINAPASAQFYHRNIPGNDGVYTDTFPSTNYNYIIGNGTPYVRKLFGFGNFAPAGIPQTISNP